jgi:hypothetical protein
LVSLIPGAEAMNTEFAAKAESDDLLFDEPAAGTAIAITTAPAIRADGSQCDLFTQCHLAKVDQGRCVSLPGARTDSRQDHVA